MAMYSPIALIEGATSLSYRSLVELADELVSSIEPRSLVFVRGNNDLATVAFYVGCLRHHIVPLMLNDDTPESAVERLMELYEPEWTWTGEARLGKPTSEYRGRRLYRLAESSPALHPDIAMLLSTSGSLGSPKLVRQSYTNIASNTASIVEYLDIKASDRVITTLPVGYTYDLSIINSHLYAGATIILNEHPVMTRAFWELFEGLRPCTFGGVPYTYQMLSRLRFEMRDLSHLRYLTQAGGRLGVSQQEHFGMLAKSRGFDFVVMYGQTEATARMSWLPPDRCLDKLGSIGIAIPGGTFELRNSEGSIINDAGEEGELYYLGKNVSLGYAECATDLTRGDDNGGVLATGDMARRDDEGFYYITGRLKRFLKVFGRRVSMDGLESLLAEKGIVAAVTGHDDAVRVFVESRDANEADAALELMTSHTGIHRSAFKVILIDALPRSESGKVLYGELS